MSAPSVKQHPEDEPLPNAYAPPPSDAEHDRPSVQAGSKDRFLELRQMDLPEQFLPDPACVVVSDLGKTGASVGFAVAGLIDYLRRERGDQRLASPWMLYRNAQRYDEWPGESYEGSSVRGGLIGWWQHGVCEASEWPGLDGQPAEDVLHRAEACKPIAFGRVRATVEDLRAAVFRLHAVVVSAEIHSGWVGAIGHDGLIPLEATPQGGHAFVVIGYTAAGFVVQNSWGSHWAGLSLEGAHVGGLAIWSYEDAARNLTDAWVARIPGRILSRSARRAGYRTDSVEGTITEQDDRLGILTEVRALAAVATAKDVEPPLSIGLFGDWGTGKSFFMRQLQGQIAQIDATARGDENSIYCSDIVQIRFNAWHYLDTNLWASLVSQIFAGLLDQIQARETDEQARARLEEELRGASELLKVTQGALDVAKQQEQKAQESLDQKRQNLATAQIALTDAAADLATLAARDPLLRSKLDAFQAELGTRELPGTVADLHQSVAEIHDHSLSLAGAARDVLRADGRGRRLAVLAGAGVVVAVVAVVVLLVISPAAQAQLKFLAGLAGQALGTLAAGAVWARDRLRQLRPKAARLQQLAQEVDRIYEDRVESLTREERDEVVKNEASVREAARTAQAAESRVTEIQLQLTQLRPAEQLREFILTRGGSGDYTKQLGIVSMVRNDFERLSELLKQRAISSNGTPGQPGSRFPVQRIILYIDDLDRCSPDRVVAVLEAVHLLLAFRLFVVVVAVDPRWIRRSLEKHYPDLLLPSEGEAARSQVTPATPQDYLEKIFQIPLYLRPISAAGYRGLIDQLVGTDVEPEEEKAEPVAEGNGEMKGADSRIPFAEGVGTGDLLVEDLHPSPEQLRFREWEMTELERLAVLFRTPRSVKRFVNTYRLLRAMVPPAELRRFEGTRRDPGEYRWPMLLLGILAGFPNTGLPFVMMLQDAVRKDPDMSWPDFKALVFEPKPPTPAFQSNGGAEGGEKPAAPGARGTDSVALPDPFAGEWRRLARALENVTPPPAISLFQPWLPSVARFSFAPESVDATS